MATLALAGILLAHAAIHAAYLAPRPPATAGGPAWPFELGRSWLLGPLGAGSRLTRTVGMALVAVTIGGFGMAVVTMLAGGPPGLWQAGVAVGAIVSFATLALYFHPWLVLGAAIDLVLLWAVLGAGWLPEGLST